MRTCQLVFLSHHSMPVTLSVTAKEHNAQTVFLHCQTTSPHKGRDLGRDPGEETAAFRVTTPCQGQCGAEAPPCSLGS